MRQGERRKHKRYEVREVHGSLLYSTNVRIIDISISGVKIESDRRLDVTKNYTIKIPRGDDVLKISGKVIWCILTKSLDAVNGEHMPVYHAGLEFPDVFSEKGSDLVSFLKNNVIVQLEERLFGRFKFNPKEPVNLNCEYDFLVKTLSRSGMLIETEVLADRNSNFIMELAIGGRKINFTGRVAHVKQIDGEGNRKIAHLGIQFIDLSVEARETLEQFIKDEIES